MAKTAGSTCSRACSAGEPGEAFLARRHVFVLVAIGARHDEAVEAAALELGPQRLHATRGGRGFGRVVERLVAGLEHGAALYGCPDGRATVCMRSVA
jgi:hypothetical protein